MTYEEKLKDPRWQKKRLEVLDRQDFTCQGCDNKRNTLHVHHLKYLTGLDPWEYEDKYLAVLCSKCHDFLHKYDLRLYHLRILARLKPNSRLMTMSEILDALLTVEYSVLIKCKTDEEPDNEYTERVLKDIEAKKELGR